MSLENDTLIALGHIGKPRGLSGELVIWPYQSDSRSFRAGLAVILQIEQKDFNTKIEFFRPAGKRLGVKFDKINSRDAAGEFVGGELLCRLEMLPEKKDGEFFIFDLVGLDIRDSDDKIVGKIKEIMNLPANDVMIVEYEDSELMIPLVKQVIEKISLEGGYVKVNNINNFVIS